MCLWQGVKGVRLSPIPDDECFVGYKQMSVYGGQIQSQRGTRWNDGLNLATYITARPLKRLHADDGNPSNGFYAFEKKPDRVIGQAIVKVELSGDVIWYPTARTPINGNVQAGFRATQAQIVEVWLNWRSDGYLRQLERTYPSVKFNVESRR